MTAPSAARMDSATRDLLASSLREVLAGAGVGLGAALAELGWDEVVADDPETATTLLFAAHGRALASSRALDDVLLAALAPVLPAGPARAVLYPRSGSTFAPGATAGVVLGPLDGVDEVVTAVAATDGTALRRLASADVTAAATPAHGFDARAGWQVVALDPAGLGEPLDPGDHWTVAVAAGRRALAAEIAGVAGTAVDLARGHVAERVQYGRPVGTFQAVRHRVAEGYAAVEGLQAVLRAAWAAVTDGPEPAARAAALAKLRAGRVQAEVMATVMQVHGAMGLTREGDVHRYVTRAAALDALLGDAGTQAEEIGAALLGGADPDGMVSIAGSRGERSTP